MKPWQSPYSCFNNNSIYFADPSGLDGEGPNGECPGDIRTNEDGTMQKYTYNGWEAANYPSKMNSSESVFNIIKQHEGLGPNTVKDKNGNIVGVYAYDDPSGYATIGYGHLIDYNCFDPETDSKDALYVNGMTVEEADQLLRTDVANTYGKTIGKKVNVPLTQSEFDVLVTSAYNGGAGKNVWGVVNDKNYDIEQVFGAFLARRSSDGVELPGLIGRRASEAYQYLYGRTPDLRNQTVKIEICTANKIQQKVVIINSHHIWINNWNNFDDRVMPIKAKQFKNYKK